MKKIITILYATTLYVFAAGNGVTIIDNPTSETINVNVSNKSANRIVLPSKILDIAYSKEKGVDIKPNENQAFIKFIPIVKEKVKISGKEKAEKIETMGEPEFIYDKAVASEAFFVTDGKTYALNLIPQDIDAQTIIINDFSKKVEEIVKYETDDDYMTILAKISQSILNGNSPNGYTVKKLNGETYTKDNIYKFHTTTSYKGVLYNAILIEVESTSKQSIVLNPKDFIQYANGTPRAITTYYGNEVNMLLPMNKAIVVIIGKAAKND